MTKRKSYGDLDRFGDLRLENRLVLPDNIVVWNEFSDLPTPIDLSDGLGLAHRVNDAHYQTGTDISTPYPIAPTADSLGRVFINGLNFSRLTYTGAGAFVRANSTNKWFTITFLNIILVGDTTNTMLDIMGTGSEFFNLNFTNTEDWGAFGQVSGQNLFLMKDTVTRTSNGPLVLTSNVINSIYQSAMSTAAPFGDAYIKIAGTALSTSIQGFQAVPVAGDSAFNIDAAHSGLVKIANSNIVTTFGGIPFKAGSLDQTDSIIAVNDTGGIPNSTSNAYINALNQGAIQTALDQNKIKRVNAIYTEKNVERFSTTTGGNIKYIGLDDIVLSILATIAGTVSTGTNINLNFYFAKGSSINTITGFADAGGGQITTTTNSAHRYKSELTYSGQTGDFTIGQIVTGSPSGATGTIKKDVDRGVTGVLTVEMIGGTFTAADTITDPITGSADVDSVQNPRIIIEDTVNYDDEYTVTEITATTFEITATFVATETGSHYEAQLFSKASNDFSGQDKNTGVVSQIEIKTNDIVFLAVENTGNTGEWNTSNIQSILASAR